MSNDPKQRRRPARRAGGSPQRGVRLLAKRVIDVALAAALVVPAALIGGACAAAILAETGRPILYCSTRLGKHGKRFRLLKLRTMYVGSDDSMHRRYIAQELSGRAAPTDSEAIHKLSHDPRITRVGRFLRRWSLDELPQLINVLRGEMSLVGPRPEVEYALDHYGPGHHRRFDVLPGMTGLWQVSGRSRVSVREMLELDVRYADNWSIWWDLRILARTLPAMLSQKGTGI